MMTTESATGHWARLLFNEVLLREAKITDERKHSWFNGDNKDIMPPLNTPLVVYAFLRGARATASGVQFLYKRNGMSKTNQFDIIRIRDSRTVDSDSANF